MMVVIADGVVAGLILKVAGDAASTAARTGAGAAARLGPGATAMADDLGVVVLLGQTLAVHAVRRRYTVVEQAREDEGDGGRASRADVGEHAVEGADVERCRVAADEDRRGDKCKAEVRHGPSRVVAFRRR